MIVAYTAIFGASDSLKPAPPAERAVCFTDAPMLNPSFGWDVIQMPTPAKPRVAARIHKMTPHELFPEAEATLWIDGSFRIHDFAALLEDVRDLEAAAFAHPDRTNCYDEGRAVVRLERANPSKVEEAIALYRSEGFAPTRLTSTGLLYRRNTDVVATFNRLWRNHLDRFGVNDQVHVDYCAWKAGLEIAHLRGNYRENPYCTYDKADHHRRRRPQFDPGDRCEHYLAG